MADWKFEKIWCVTDYKFILGICKPIQLWLVSNKSGEIPPTTPHIFTSMHDDAPQLPQSSYGHYPCHSQVVVIF